MKSSDNNRTSKKMELQELSTLIDSSIALTTTHVSKLGIIVLTTNGRPQLLWNNTGPSKSASTGEKYYSTEIFTQQESPQEMYLKRDDRLIETSKTIKFYNTEMTENDL